MPGRNSGLGCTRSARRTCLSSNRELGLYVRLLPYQFAAGNERDDDHKIRRRAQLPSGMTIDDFGFGIVRHDGRTPRPTYDWLLREQVNRAIQDGPSYLVEVRCRPPKQLCPIGCDYS
jgi:hypothetical protein